MLLNAADNGIIAAQKSSNFTAETIWH